MVVQLDLGVALHSSSLMAKASKEDPRKLRVYRRAVTKVLDENFAKLSSVLNGCMKSFAEKAFSADLINDEVRKRENFSGIIDDFKAGLDWKNTVQGMWAHCDRFLEILKDLGGPVKYAGDELTAKLIIAAGM